MEPTEQPAGWVTPPWRRRVRAVVEGVRYLWLVVGITLLMMVALEFAYRAQGALRRSIRRLGSPPGEAATPAPEHPYADSAWYPVFRSERDSLLRWRWEPFVYSRMRPLRGRFVTIDSSTGVRVTPVPPSDAARRQRVFFFGGSTTWGFADRDGRTRPAVVARRLEDAGVAVEAVNFGQLGYVGAQSMHTLVSELRRGNVPDAVVFWDGVNDLNSAAFNGVAGVSYRERERAEDADFNTATRRRGGFVDPRTAVRGLIAHSEVFRRLLAFTAVEAPRTAANLGPVPFCRMVMGDWAGQARLVAALGRAYGFVAILVWQPQWQTSGRPQSAYEREVASTTIRDAAGELEPHRQECARLADSLATEMPGVVFNWSRMHSEDTATVFIDEYSHTTERVTAIEADTLAKVLLPLLEARK